MFYKVLDLMQASEYFGGLFYSLQKFTIYLFLFKDDIITKRN